MELYKVSIQWSNNYTEEIVDGKAIAWIKVTQAIQNGAILAEFQPIASIR